MTRFPRSLTTLALLLLLALSPLVATPNSALAQAEAKPTTPTIESVRKNPDDAKELNAFFSAQFRAIATTLRSDPAAAEKLLTKLKTDLASITPTKDEAKTLITRAQTALTFYGNQIELGRLKLEDLAARLKTSPENLETLTKYTNKALSEISSNVYSDAAAAGKLLESVRAQLTEVKAKAKDKTQVVATVDRTLKTLEAYEKRLATEKSRNELVGKKAAPLEVEAWVNGSPLTDADLKGKVVLIDFWAVWCGPCIATFPHLREWNAKYADKGLVMLGLTRYYNYEWDEKTNKAVANREKGKVTPAAEQAMLAKFAEANKLTHRFGVQKGNAMSEYYGVTGIPQVVVIDREGTVRLIKVGSGDENAKAIGDLLEKLLGAAGAAGQQ